MKNSILTGVSVLALTLSGAALAQNNNSTVTQTGSGAQATVTQDGANDQSTVSQSLGGTVTVDQTGDTGSTSTVTTLADDNAPDSTVKVTQSDDGSSSEATGQANTSSVIQDNVNLGSSVNVTQTHNAAGEGKNNSVVLQGRNASNGDVTVSQEGGENDSFYSSRDSTDNDAFITQTGVRNSSNVVQNFQNGGALATVNQTNTAGGATNNADISQTSTGYAPPPPDEFALGADASITQDGEGNNSSITQTGFANIPAEANEAINAQFGDDNNSSINQTGVIGYANVLQTGNENDSTVSQSGAGSSATVTQNQDNSRSVVTQNSGATATVSQTRTQELFPLLRNGGSSNNSEILQTAVAGGATASLTQQGELNTSFIVQTADADATVNQTGIYNDSTVIQNAAGTTASVTQIGIPSLGGSGVGQGDNLSNITQNGAGSSATVLQTANNPTNGAPSNDSRIQQDGMNGFAEVTQTGDNNESDVDQSATNNDAVVIQNGDFNRSAVTQQLAGNAARVTQSGQSNQSDVFQSSGVSSLLGYGSTELGEAVLNDPNQSAFAVVQQTGNDLRSSISSTGAGGFAFVQQIGSDNRSAITQSGNANVAFVEQASSGNRSTWTQTGSFTNLTSSEDPYPNGNNIGAADGVHQTGASNTSFVVQSGSASSFGAALAGRNAINVDQTGSDNESDIDQGGVDNRAELTQSGAFNDSFIDQLGTGNTASVTQSSNGNLSSVIQSGSGNNATVNQGPGI